MDSRYVLVVGGAGQIGSLVARDLLASPFQVKPVIIDRRDNDSHCLDGVLYHIDPSVDVFDGDFMFKMVQKFEPLAIIDAVNIASIASRNVDLAKTVLDYSRNVIAPIAKKGIIWIDVGTVGTGGMGLEIPYTHNEPTQDGAIAHGLWLKVGAAGMHGGYLDLIGRTPNCRVGRVVPRGMVGFEEPKYQEVSVAHLNGTIRLVHGSVIALKRLEGVTFTDEGPYVSTVVRCGENGLFGLEETSAITSIGQMETVSAEAVSQAVMVVFGELMAVAGTYVQKDLNPDVTSHAQARRVLKQMKDIQAREARKTTSIIDSVAFGNLGPYLTTNLWELNVFAMNKLVPHQLEHLKSLDPSDKILKYYSRVLPALGIPVITDHFFIPCVEGGNMTMSRDIVLNQLNRVLGSDKSQGSLWSVDLRASRVKHWADVAKQVNGFQCLRSELPFSPGQIIKPGLFWGAFQTASGHGRPEFAKNITHIRFLHAPKACFLSLNLFLTGQNGCGSVVSFLFLHNR